MIVSIPNGKGKDFSLSIRTPGIILVSIPNGKGKGIKLGGIYMTTGLKSINSQWER